MTQHPVINKCVRQLIYDAVEFPPKLSKKDYVREVYRQLQNYHAYGSKSPTLEDCDMCNFVYCVFSRKVAFNEMFHRFKDSEFIRVSYAAYQEHATFQEIFLRNGRFFKVRIFNNPHQKGPCIFSQGFLSLLFSLRISAEAALCSV